MTSRLPFRPVLVLGLCAGLAACGGAEDGPDGFEAVAERIAAAPLDGLAASGEPTRSPPSAARGLRPALRVEVLDPHALWDARDGGLGEMARFAADAPPPETSEADHAPAPRLRPSAPIAPDAAALVQLGAYTDETAARVAWSRLQAGSAAAALAGLSPVLEPVEVNGRRLVRLKTTAPAAGAAALCEAAGVDDPWCRRGA